MFKKIMRCISPICIASALLFALSVFAMQDKSLFSDENFVALNKNPAELLSKTNACRLKNLLGPNDYNLFSEAMSLMTNEDDAANYLAISGGARGLFTIFEGFYRMSRDGKVWIAYLYDNKVHYFTNDQDSLQSPPKIMIDWSSRFKDAKWIGRLIKIGPDNCT